MKRFSVALFLNFVFMVACTTDELPPGIMNPDTMKSVLTDIHIKEAEVDVLGLSPDSARLLYKAYESEILKKHNITKRNLDESIKYYLEHSTELDRIYENVITEITIRQSKQQAE